jgi:thiamine pyrophosphokinase
MRLIVTPNLPDPDGFYAALLAAHQGLTAADSAALNARLILTLANHVGDMDVLTEALALAR